MGLSKADPVGTVIECDSQGNPTIRWAKAPRIGDCFYSAPSIPEGWQTAIAELDIAYEHAAKISGSALLAGEKCPDGDKAALYQISCELLNSIGYARSIMAAPQPGEGKP